MTTSAGARPRRPALGTLRPNRLGLANLRGDLYGGVTAGIVALPLALAFGVASGAGPVAGVYGAICVGLFAALFGGTPSQISGPTGPMTIVYASVFTQFGTQPAVAFTVVMMAGLFQVLLGWFRMGRYVNLMPYPVISGFMTGIGCILIIMQLDPLLGYPGPQNVVNALTVLPGYLAHPHWHAVAIGLAALAICLFTPRSVGRIVPPPLLALVVGSLMALGLTDAKVLGEIPTGLPAPHWPSVDLALAGNMIASAGVLAALGSIDSLLTSLVADNATRTFHDSDKELVGQGIGNFVSGLLGGIPGAGATVRTLTNVKAGGRTPLSGVIHAAVLFAIMLGLGRVVAFVPYAALAGVLLKVGIDVIDWRYLRRAHRAPRADFVLMLVVLVLTVLVDVITAVGVGVVLASLVFVKSFAELQSESIRTIVEVDPEKDRLFTPAEAEVFRQCGGRALVLHLSGLMSFGAANEMARRVATVGRYDVILIDLVDVPRMAGSAAIAREEISQRAKDEGQHVIVVGLSYPVARLLGNLGVLDLVRETERFATRGEAVAAAAAHVRGAS